jgi:NTE family protein
MADRRMTALPFAPPVVRYRQHGHRPQVGLVLGGGGARAAYQVGVLNALARIRRESNAPRANPFPVIVGTSAGAINAAALASHADRFDFAVSHLVEVWRTFRAEQVYRSDAIGVIRSGALWLTLFTVGWAIARWWRLSPRSLLDNRPLADLLERTLNLGRVRDVMRAGHLQALAVSASGYTSGTHVTFYEAVDRLRPWTRERRIAVPGPITLSHLLASSAIPFVFPAAPLEIAGRVEWFGDGSMREVAPISPAIHLGAERVLVIGSGRMYEPPDQGAEPPAYPSLAQIAGHALSSIFLDSLAVDIERLRRINRTYALLSPEARSRTTLRAIDVLVIAPSQRLDDIAARHINSLPRAVRSLLSAVGVRGRNGQEPSGAALASYLLFEAPYTGELIALGERDTLARRDEVLRFFGWGRRSGVTADASSIGTMPGAGAKKVGSARCTWRVPGGLRVDQARTTDPQIR